MFMLRRPSEKDLVRLLTEAAALPLSYSPVGIARTGAPGFTLDSSRDVVGHGERDYHAAVEALFNWRVTQFSWVRFFPSASPVTEDAPLAIVAHHLGFYSVNVIRIVHVLRGSGRRAGFAYGTTTQHAESGEELFEVEWQPETDQIWYEVRAVSRQRHPLARLGYPYARMLQHRFRRDSIAAMKRAITP